MTIESRKKLAKMLTIHGYRNSPIENIHASGRISDEEMKHLNKTIYNQMYTLITMMDEGSLYESAYFMDGTWGMDWDEPVLLDWAETMLKK